MIKILYNNMVLDINKNEKYVKFVPEINRFISSPKDLANGILGSDNNTVYHLSGTNNNFINKTKSVTVEQISQKEFSELANKMLFQQEEDIKLKEDVESLKQMINQQNFLIQQLLEKFN